MTPLDEFSRRDIEFHRETAASFDDEITRVYAVYHRFLLEPYLDRIAATFPGGRALDLGCGTGVVSLALARRGFQVVGIDHSQEMLTIAREKAAAAGLADSCHFVLGDVCGLSFEDEEFDCVTCQGLLHHLEDTRPTLEELARVLRRDGAFYISEPSQESTPAKRALLALWRLLHMGRGSASTEGPESVEAPIDSREVRTTLGELGLEFELRFLTHIPPLRRALRDGPYLAITRALSFPWRRRRGDLLFVFGHKPGAVARLSSRSC